MNGYPPISRHPNFLQYFNPSRGLQADLVGDWKKLPALFRYLGGGNFNTGIKRDIAKAVRDFCTVYKKNLVQGLATGGVAIGADWLSHKESYIKARKPHTVGVLRGIYLDALNNLQITQEKYILSLSFRQGDLNRKSAGGYTLGQYSVIFEKGTDNGKQPGRPLWSTAFEKTGGQGKILKNIHGAVGKRIKELTT